MDIIKALFDGIIRGILVNHELLICTIILGILCLFLKLYYPKFRGFMGEFWVKNELNKLPKDKYVVLNDIMIEDENGTHQIDHIVLSYFGIFVIEMKNYYGLIKGKEYDSKWCQCLGKNRRYFMNPIHQNFGHVKALSILLKLDENYFIQIVCFSNQANLKISVKSSVLKLDNLLNEIKKYNKKVLEEDLNKYKKLILSYNIIDKEARKKHVKNIHNTIKADNNLIDNGICPKCGSRLVEKNGKYGKFIGCSNFPKCRFIKK